MSYLKKYYKYKLKQSGGSFPSNPDDKLLFIITCCAQNGFVREIKPFINLNKSFRYDDQLLLVLTKTIDTKEKKLIFAAIKYDDIERVRYLIPYSNINDGFMFYALDYAIDNNRINIISLLLNHGAIARYYTDQIALFRAIGMNNIPLLSVLLNENNINIIYHYMNHTLLTYAVDKNRIDIVRLLVERGINVNASFNPTNPISLKRSMISYANSKYDSKKPLQQRGEQYKNIRDILSRYGAQYNDRENLGKTALMLAVENGMVDIVEYLCANGANVHGEMYI